MAYQIRCRKCETETWVGNIGDLIAGYTATDGRLRCGGCSQTETYVAQITGRWEQEPTVGWTDYIQGLIALPAETTGVTPVLFLTAPTPDGEVSGMRLSYCTAPALGQSPTLALGPGTAPSLSFEGLRHLLMKLGRFGAIRPQDLDAIAQTIRRDDGLAAAA